MKVSEERPGSAYVIHAYGEGEITVGLPTHERTAANEGKLRLTCSFLITAEQLTTDWPPERLEELRREHLDPLAALQPDVVIFGVGPTLRFPDPAILAPLTEKGIGVEVMDSRAACRTYNVLAGEGRRVAGALLMP